MELALQPTNIERSGGASKYRWEYRQIMFGQPVRLDILGIAPIDRLGELIWLGPLSVLMYELLVGLAVHAAGAARFDRWMLLLTIGAFAGAYPLMYFAQEYISLGPAVLLSSGLAIGVILVRSVTLVGAQLAIARVMLPASAGMAFTLVEAIWPQMQGILLTLEALGFFIVLMMLMPRVCESNSAPQYAWGQASNPATG